MGILVIARSINPRPLSAIELTLSGLIMESRVDTAGDNQNPHVITSNYRATARDNHTTKFLTVTGQLQDITSQLRRKPAWVQDF